MTWLKPIGEINFFKKPSKTLKVSVTTDKAIYAPGDQVTYTVSVQALNSKGVWAPTTVSTYVSVTVTDDSVFQLIDDLRQPPSLASRTYLENEVKVGDNQEFLYANQYVEHWYSNSTAPSSSDSNLELLLGVQGWRFRVFDYQNIYTQSQT